MEPQKSKPAPKLTFENKIATPNLMAQPGKDEVGWTCDNCGATNSDIVHSYCQFCGQ